MAAFNNKVTAKYEVFAMSNLRSSETGVEGTVIWVSAGEFGGRDSQHGPRVKVMLGNKVNTEGLDAAITVTLTDPPRVLGSLPAKVEKKAIEFVAANLGVLLPYWKNEISTREMLDQITAV